MGVVANRCIDTGSRLSTLLWVVYEYDFSNSQMYTIGPKTMATIEEAEAECPTLILRVESSMLLNHQEKAAGELFNPIAGVAAESVIPDFPDELPLSDPDPSVSTRQREFHRYLLRFVWPLDLLDVTKYFLAVWVWIDQMTTPNLRIYLNIDVATSNAVSQRMGNSLTMGELLDADEPGEIA